MPDIDLTQDAANELIRAEKHCIGDDDWKYPMFGGKLMIPLTSPNRHEEFSLDINRSEFALSKSTYQNRVRRVIVLVRLDLNGSPHRNPDGEDVPCPHIHVYREGYGDKWAYPLPEDFTDPSDAMVSLTEFMSYCNITVPPRIKPGLFV